MKLHSPFQALVALSLLWLNVFQANAMDIDPTQPEQVRSAAKQVAAELVSMYATTTPDGSTTTILSGIPGLLPYPPYYWWEAGAMFGSLIEYWYYTGDDTYNNLVRDGILFQIGDQRNLMPANQSKDEGNDDQLFWAFTAMSAAELHFPDPPPDQPGWLAIAQSVMNQLIERWDDQYCNGGLRWQIYQWLAGYNYKNTASNGGLFQLGARLALYTGNQTYADWAEKAYDWLAQSPMLVGDGTVFDGTNVLKNCGEVDRTQWSYNYGIMIGGAAYMYNYTSGSPLWASRLSAFLSHTSFFFPPSLGGTMTELCEGTQKCNIDQWSFKAFLARWLAVSAQLAPYTAPQIMPLIQHSAQAAARQCNGAGNIPGNPSAGGGNGTRCGSRWNFPSYDGNGGVGQQMSALSVIQSSMIQGVRGLVGDGRGGSSEGNPAAGTDDYDNPVNVYFGGVTTADRAGAGILTVLAVGGFLGTGWWMCNGKDVVWGRV